MQFLSVLCTLKRPRFGLSWLERILRAVLLPMPLVPTNPKTCPGLGVGNRWSLNEFGPKRCVCSLLRLVGKLMMVMALKGHFLMHIPQPMHNVSEMKAMRSVGTTSIHNFPTYTEK